MISKQTLDTFPTQAGVYLMKNEQGQVLYVGKARHLKHRLRQYFVNCQDTRANIPFLLQQVVEVQTIVVNSEKEALMLESVLIKKHQPRYNILLKDDKSYLYLRLTDEVYPRIELVRQKGGFSEKAHYFGPYLNRNKAEQLLFFLQKHFPLRRCSQAEFATRKRPCILHEMQRCIAPCVKKCTELEYVEVTEALIHFMKTRGKEWIETMRRDMEIKAELLEFEAASLIFKEIEQIKDVLEPQFVMSHKQRDCDVIGFYRQAERGIIVQLSFRGGVLLEAKNFPFEGSLQDEEEIISAFLMQQNLPEGIEMILPGTSSEALKEILQERSVMLTHPKSGEKRRFIEMAQNNAKAAFEQLGSYRHAKEQTLHDIKEALGLDHYPATIECYDTSHLSGSLMVSAAVAYVDGESFKERYRKYALKHSSSNDLDALQQVLERRCRQQVPLPSCLLIDGGRQHLQVARKVLDAHQIIGVDLIAIAKDEQRHDKGLSQERFYINEYTEYRQLPVHSSALFLLQQIRDEAHRVAIQYQRLLRIHRMTESALDQIEGIGPIKKKRLLTHFKSVAALKKASLEEILSVKGIAKKDAERLLAFFSPFEEE